MEYKPHDYQQFAINYILEHPIAAVILGMGLGKTSITLTAIEQLIYDSFEVSFGGGATSSCKKYLE
jgi:superfamily II DNA or RNA helicase